MGRNFTGSSGIVSRDKRKYQKDLVVQQTVTEGRLSNLETSERHLLRMVQLSTLFLDGVTLTSGVDYTPVVSPTTALGVDNIQGVFANFWITPLDGTRDIFFGSSDDTLSAGSQRYRWQAAGVDVNRNHTSQMLAIEVGVDGNIKIQSTGGNATGFMALFGYWL